MTVYDKTYALGANEGSSVCTSNQYIVLHDTGNANNVDANSAINEAAFMPALGVLIGALGKVYGWSWTDSAVTTISAVAAFLGTVFMISSSQYKKESDQ